MISSPFTLDRLLSLQQVAYDVPLHLSPNGRWLVASIQTLDRNTPSKVFHFGEDGVPTTMQGTRVLIVDPTTGETQNPFSQRTSWVGCTVVTGWPPACCLCQRRGHGLFRSMG